MMRYSLAVLHHTPAPDPIHTAHTPFCVPCDDTMMQTDGTTVRLCPCTDDVALVSNRNGYAVGLAVIQGVALDTDRLPRVPHFHPACHDYGYLGDPSTDRCACTFYRPVVVARFAFHHSDLMGKSA